MDDEPALIEFRDVCRRFGTQEVLRDISFRINRGESVAIIGESGCGKSVTLKLMIALLAALVFCRRREVADALVHLLQSTVHWIGARALARRYAPPSSHLYCR